MIWRLEIHRTQKAHLSLKYILLQITYRMYKNARTYACMLSLSTNWQTMLITQCWFGVTLSIFELTPHFCTVYYYNCHHHYHLRAALHVCVPLLCMSVPKSRPCYQNAAIHLGVVLLQVTMNDGQITGWFVIIVREWVKLENYKSNTMKLFKLPKFI